MSNIVELIHGFFEKINMPTMSWTDIIEILVIAFLVYEIMLWVKNTGAFALLKGIIVIALFLLFAEIFEMSTILWIANKLFTIAATVIVVVFQPELRRALEHLGRKNYLPNFFENNRTEGLFSDKTLEEIINACNSMARVKTGALIVVEQNTHLDDIVKTGIAIDSLVSNQLLINIFEHNTPLHDGAVVVRGDRIVAATCYLPLSDNLSLSKDLGTRHRAGVGISEVSDSMTVIVSEETGRISIAYGGKLTRITSREEFKAQLEMIQNKHESTEKKLISFKGKGAKHEH